MGCQTMTEKEIIKEFITVHRKGNEMSISVRMIEWRGPHAPTTNTVNAVSITGHATDEMIQTEIGSILRNPIYFRNCKECGQLNPVGWMNAMEDICDRCAEQNHDVVF